MKDWLKRMAPPAATTGDRADLLWLQGSRLLERKRFPQAIAAMREALELEPSRLVGRLNLAAALYLVKEYEEAITHLRYVLALEPQNTVALMNLAASLDATGHLHESIAILEQLVADRPQWHDAHYNLALAYVKDRRFEAAAEACRSELQLNPTHVGARNLLQEMVAKLKMMNGAGS